ncbi:hypothetical protein ACFLY3_04190 [Chloroflexota bacterium]
MIEEGTIAVAFGLAVVVVFLAVFLWNLITAPPKMEKDLSDELNNISERLVNLENEKIPHIIATPITVETNDFRNREQDAYAELKIQNTSPITTLDNVRVQIVEQLGVYDRQDNKGEYFVHSGYEVWRSANVYWSEEQSEPKQISIR